MLIHQVEDLQSIRKEGREKEGGGGGEKDDSHLFIGVASYYSIKLSCDHHHYQRGLIGGERHT